MKNIREIMIIGVFKVMKSRDQSKQMFHIWWIQFLFDGFQWEFLI